MELKLSDTGKESVGSDVGVSEGRRVEGATVGTAMDGVFCLALGAAVSMLGPLLGVAVSTTTGATLGSALGVSEVGSTEGTKLMGLSIGVELVGCKMG
jgi:hypothetical protein